MSRNYIVMLAIAVGLLAGIIIVAIVQGGETTDEEINQRFCDDVGEFVAAVGELRDIDRDTPLSEFEETREIVRQTYEDMIESALDVPSARTEDLQAANEKLRAAADQVTDDATLGEALDAIKDEAKEVDLQISKLLNDVNCGSGIGGQERSGE